MSLSVMISPGSRVLAGNPIKMSVASDSKVTYTIAVAGEVLYTGSGIGSFDVFIHDIVESAMSAQMMYNNDERLLIPATGNGVDVTISLVNADGETASRNFTAYMGGVSKTTLRSLGQSNIFTGKFCNYEGNFFFTTRGGSSHICMRESEVSPMLFIYPTGVSLSARCGDLAVSLPGTAGNMYGLNIYAIRKQLFMDSGQLVNRLEIYYGELLACTICLLPCSMVRERYYVRFLNSLGCYEIVELTASAQVKATFADESTYNEYDDVVDDYVQRRQRQRSRKQIELESGYKSRDELSFLLDMLSSDDVTLLGYEGNDVKVHPVCEDWHQAIHPTSPDGIPIILRFADDEQRLSADLSLDKLGDSRIHTEQFTQQFN